ncbi:rpa1 [Ecytonucleospora hepatopenaei]|uniref:DNA-directed RNA polymerase subunit n=1 Tax=Ecytonucleospora hepatopenaei TaxID=646526 RepID=A0A1W0E3J9_9MICR|nr:rpa1 [Ecytonucleospora hepatopenaei]
MISNLKFKWYKQKEIISLADIKVTEARSLDKFGHAVENGFYDLHMGPCEKDEICKTCSLDFLSCPGHFGYLPIRKSFNPLSFELLVSLLKCICFNCKKMKLTPTERLNFYLEMSKAELVINDLNNSNVETYEELANIISLSEERNKDMNKHVLTVYDWIKRMNSKVKCMECNKTNPRIKKIQNAKIANEIEGELLFMKVTEIYEIMYEAFKNENVLFEKMFNTDFSEYKKEENDGFESTLINDMFFIENILISPNKMRPAKMRDGMIYENPMNTQLTHILNMSMLAENDSKFEGELQVQINAYYDSAQAKDSKAGKEGIKQVLEKKEGLFRQNIMGKRVNFSARSVISPDPCLETGEIGVPLVFAQQLTFPEKLNKYNQKKLSEAVVNGHNFYPGANYLRVNGEMISLKHVTREKRKKFVESYIEGNFVNGENHSDSNDVHVYRHLVSGDKVLVNRQPTLHVVSLMGHTVRVLKNEKTLRMHYVNCKSYNADFDGDEMNIHFPQDLQSISEINEVCSTDRLYFVPSTNAPIRGLSQDHLVGATVLTLPSEFFLEWEYRQIVFNAIYAYVYKMNIRNKRDKIVFLEGSICCGSIKYFTGKDIVSTILINLGITDFSYCQKGKVDGDNVLFVNSIMVTGLLDKNTLGTSPNNIIHVLSKKYSTSICNVLLTVFGRMVNEYVIHKGFTLSYDDLLLNKEGEEKLNNNLHCFYKVANNKHKLTEEIKKEAGVLFKKVNESVSDLQCILNEDMSKQKLKNNMLNIIQSGAKGSMVNLSQISICLGQQELEGRRVPQQISGKSLPCFSSVDYYQNVSAGGFVLERFLTGLSASSFYFHCMAGREGLIDTAVKTANSGYLQRCLVKHMEGITVAYDGSIRLKNVNNRIICYGSEDIPGTSVGVIAAQSIGEPSTQMTLNTFHLAGVGGRNVTLGIPRLREIVMVASKTIKTPSIALNAVPKNISDDLIETFNVLTAYDMVNEIKITEKYVKERNFAAGGYSKRLSIVISISHEYQEEGIFKEFVTILNQKFMRKLNKMLRLKLSAIEILDEEKKEDAEYKNEKSDQETSSDENSSESDVTIKNGNHDLSSNDDTKVDDDMTDDEILTATKNDDISNTQEENDDNLFNVENSIFKIKNKRIFLHLKYPSNFKANVMEHVENTLKSTIIREVDGFGGAKAVKANGVGSNNCELYDVYLEGSTFINLFGMSIFHNNMKMFYNSLSNDIYSVYIHFGIEAARSVIVSEIENVFGVYGISIEQKHLELTADYMTRNGNYGAFNRHSFDINDSIIQRMSYESCFTKIKEAGRFCLEDNMSNPSANISVGNLIKNGTGSFDVLYDFNA